MPPVMAAFWPSRPALSLTRPWPVYRQSGIPAPYAQPQPAARPSGNLVARHAELTKAMHRPHAKGELSDAKRLNAERARVSLQIDNSPIIGSGGRFA